MLARQNSADEPTSVADAAATTRQPAVTEVVRDAAYFRRAAEWGIQAAEALELPSAAAVRAHITKMLQEIGA